MWVKFKFLSDKRTNFRQIALELFMNDSLVLKKNSLWAYPECLIIETIQNNIRNHSILQNSLFFLNFDTFSIHFLFQTVLLLFFSVQQLTIVRISKFCPKTISTCYILNKWIMIQYSNKVYFSLNLVKTDIWVQVFVFESNLYWFIRLKCLTIVGLNFCFSHSVHWEL